MRKKLIKIPAIILTTEKQKNAAQRYCPMNPINLAQKASVLGTPEKLEHSLQSSKPGFSGDKIRRSTLSIPLALSPVTAGFPSPAEDYIEQELDLNELLIKHPAATYFMRVSGDSMIGAGIHEGDIVIVDRSLPVAHNKIVIASVNGELTIKRIYQEHDIFYLVPENNAFTRIKVTSEMNVEVWGIVTYVIHQL